MKFVDNNFKDIQNPCKEKGLIDIDYDELIRRMISFLSLNLVDYNTIDTIKEDISNLIIEISDGKAYSTKYNGEVSKRALPKLVAAATPIEQDVREDAIYITPGIIVNENYMTNSPNTDINSIYNFLVHELFHSFSTTVKQKRTDQKNVYKSGIMQSYYDKDDNNVSSDIGNNEGLNEGITQYLTDCFLNHYSGNAYEFQTAIAHILSKNNPLLLDAYFSRNEKLVYDFLKSFEERQDVVSSLNLTNMEADIIYDGFSLLKGAILYDLSYVPEEKKKEELDSLKEIVFRFIDNDYCYDYLRGDIEELFQELSYSNAI